MLRDALGMIDDAFIEESISFFGGDAAASSERKSKVNKYMYLSKRTKMWIAVGAALCIMLSLVVTAAAANLWGIRELLEGGGRELPEEAYNYVEPQEAVVQEEKWSCAVTESLCDGDELMIAVTIECSEDYILAFVDSSPTDPAGSIGVDYDGTLFEYAKSQGKDLLYAAVYIKESEELPLSSGSMHFERISDDCIMVLSGAIIEGAALPPTGICEVRIRGAVADEQELEFTINEAPGSAAIYLPADRQAVAGIIVESATVTESPLGISVTISGTVLDKVIYGDMEFVCEGITGMQGGKRMDETGAFSVNLTNGQGSVSDTLTVQVMNVETGELMGELEFVRI